jgi:hypothetical protein
MSTKRDRNGSSDASMPGIPDSHPRTAARAAEARTRKTNLPPCLFYDSVTQFFCLLSRRKRREQGFSSCTGCSGS